MPQPDVWRLFFAIEPSLALRQRLSAHRSLWHWRDGARLGVPAKLHLTLVFMPRVDSSVVPRLLALGAQVAQVVRPGRLRLDHAGVWAPNAIAHLAPSRIPATLRDLHDRLRTGVLGAGIETDRRPWNPHVTLARNAYGALPPQRFEPLSWDVHDFSLQRSVLSTGKYEELARWRIHRTS